MGDLNCCDMRLRSCHDDPLPLASRFIWLAWGGVMAMEAVGWRLGLVSPSAMLALRGAELLWLGGLIQRYAQQTALGLRLPTRAEWRLLAVVALACVLIAALLGWLGWLAPWLRLPPIAEGIGGAALMLLLAPLVEELLFRGLLYRMLAEEVGAWPAIAISAACFALAHGALLSPQLLGGLLFAAIYARSGNLWLPILLHSGANGALLLLHALR